MKTCRDCQQQLDTDLFLPRPRNADGLDIRCRRCRNIRYKKRDIATLVRRIYASQCSNSIGRKHPAPSYSLEELQTWAIQQPLMQQLFATWVTNDFQKDLAPSIDRINPNQPYDLHNIQVLTWQENRAKGGTDKKVGIDVSTSRAVSSYDPAGKLLRTYPSVAAAARAVKGHEGAINAVASQKQLTDGRGYSYTPKTHKGIIWKWA